MELVSLSPFPAELLLWEADAGQPSMTVVVKVTLRLVHDGEATVADTQIPIGGDAPWDESPVASVFRPGDRAPLKPRTDIVLVGHAHAPGGKPVERLVASLKVGDFSKSITITATRAWTTGPGGFVPGPPLLFDRMPLRYERGALTQDNPVGIDPALPPVEGALVGPTLAAIAPATFPCFGPISAAWRPRRRLLGEAGRFWALAFETGTGPGEPAPRALDFRFFNVAPPDQQTALLRQRADIELVNLHPTLPTLRTRLPALRPQVFHVSARGGRPVEVALRCDTLWIDADQGVACLVWRGLTDVPSIAPQNSDTVIVVAESQGKRVRFDQVERAWREGVPIEATVPGAEDALGVRHDAVRSRGEESSSGPAGDPTRPAEKDETRAIGPGGSSTRREVMPFSEAKSSAPAPPVVPPAPGARPAPATPRAGPTPAPRSERSSYAGTPFSAPGAVRIAEGAPKAPPPPGPPAISNTASAKPPTPSPRLALPVPLKPPPAPLGNESGEWIAAISDDPSLASDADDDLEELDAPTHTGSDEDTHDRPPAPAPANVLPFAPSPPAESPPPAMVPSPAPPAESPPPAMVPSPAPSAESPPPAMVPSPAPSAESPPPAMVPSPAASAGSPPPANAPEPARSDPFLFVETPAPSEPLAMPFVQRPAMLAIPPAPAPTTAPATRPPPSPPARLGPLASLLRPATFTGLPKPATPAAPVPESPSTPAPSPAAPSKSTAPPPIAGAVPRGPTSVPPPAPDPLPPTFDPREVPVATYGAVSAELMIRRGERAKVLDEHKLSEPAWARIHAYWTGEMGRETARGESRLLARFDLAYVETMGRLRKPIGVPEYAAILVAIERGAVDRQLAQLSLSLSDLMRVQRVWTRRVIDDPELGKALSKAIEEARAAELQT